MKYLSLLLVLMLPSVGMSAVPKAVFVKGNVADVSQKFSLQRNLTFLPLQAGAFVAPKITGFVKLEIPYSIRMETKAHDVEVGVVLDEKGKVLAAQIVTSNCKDFEANALSWAKAVTYSPALFDGKPVAFYVVVPVGYSYVTNK